MLKRVFLLLLCLAMLPLAACGEAKREKTGVQIVATLFPQYDFARAIAGEHAEVELLLDFGADAHSYDPTPRDIMTIAGADLFLYTGADMEPWAEKLLASADIQRAIASGSLSVVDLSGAVERICTDGHADGEEHDHGHDHAHGAYDPHIWTSIAGARAMSEAILRALMEKDPAHRTEYRANAAAYDAELVMLGQALGEALSGAQRDTCYFGGSFAFAYLFHEAGLSHVSVFHGCASHAEPSAAQIAAVVGGMRASGARYLFYDGPAEEKTARVIAAETGAELLRLHAIHNISKKEFAVGENYLSLMRQNIEALGKALG